MRLRGIEPPAARAEIEAAVDAAVHYAGWTDKLHAVLGAVNPVAAPYFDFTMPEPTGVVGVHRARRAGRARPRRGAPAAAGGRQRRRRAGVRALAAAAAATSARSSASPTSPPASSTCSSGLRSELVPPLAGHRDVDAIVDATGAGLDEQLGAWPPTASRRVRSRRGPTTSTSGRSDSLTRIEPLRRAQDRLAPGRRVIAARLVAPGDPPAFALEDVPDPVPGPGEVTVRLEAAALNRRDWWIWRKAGTRVPAILGSDGAGRIAAVGQGVTGLAPGDEVVIDCGLAWGPSEDAAGEDFAILGYPTDGTFAELVRVPAINVAPRPARLTWHEAAALNLAGLTAWRCAVTCAGAAPGRSVLVHGAGSGVATFAIQIAAALGARVFVTTSSEAKLEHARSLGAEAGVLYSDEDWPARLRALAGGGLDAAIDSYGGPALAPLLEALRPGGTLVNFGDTGGDDATIPVAAIYWHWRTLRGTTLGSPREYRALLAHVETAAWRPEIDRVYPLEQIAEAAARLSASDRFGKVVLQIA